MAEDGGLAGAYAPATQAFLPRQGPAARVLDWLPLRPFIAVHVGFARRFDKAALRLAGSAGGAVSSSQAALFFGWRLRLEIDPRRLVHRLSDYVFDRGKARWIGELFLDGGGWDAILSPITESPAHQEILDICRMRHGFRDSDLYRRMVRRIERGDPRVRNGIRLDSIAKLDSYFQYYVDLIENIERNGVLPRHRLGRSQRIGASHRLVRSVWLDVVERDIGVAVGPDGSLVRHTSGKHRTAAAIALGLERVPVEIRMVHMQWLATQMQRFDLPPARALTAALTQAGAHAARPGPGLRSLRPQHAS